VTTIFPNSDGQAWEFSVAEFQEALTSAGSAQSGRLDA
jgi:hypothetical protein